MTTISKTLRKMGRTSLIATLALTALLTPASGFAAERDGSVLFFSLADVQQMLSNPTLPSAPDLSYSFTWRDQRQSEDQGSLLERNYYWGNKLGIDGYAKPGNRPLWGY
jgi:hypothetical protein